MPLHLLHPQSPGAQHTEEEEEEVEVDEDHQMEGVLQPGTTAAALSAAAQALCVDVQGLGEQEMDMGSGFVDFQNS
jgi:hypothetical protein